MTFSGQNGNLSFRPREVCVYRSIIHAVLSPCPQSPRRLLAGVRTLCPSRLSLALRRQLQRDSVRGDITRRLLPLLPVQDQRLEDISQDHPRWQVTQKGSLSPVDDGASNEGETEDRSNGYCLISAASICLHVLMLWSHAVLHVACTCSSVIVFS